MQRRLIIRGTSRFWLACSLLGFVSACLIPGPEAFAQTAETSPDQSEVAGPNSEGPNSEGTNSEGTNSEGTNSEGTDSEGPSSEGPSSEGPSSEGPSSEGPSSEGPNSEGPSSEIVEEAGDAALAPAESDQPGGQRLNLLWLAVKGGPLMIAIGIASLLTVAVVVERLLALRRSRVMPVALVRGLAGATTDGEQFDPRKAYRLCQTHPSSLANVVKAMLLKVGRPQPEVERAAQEAAQREADTMYRNVRWLNLVAAVAPLIGLLGTVWGMIRAFFDTTQLQAGQNKADFLASGIYVALVTTLGGLAVAIPAAIFAHYFEGRIQSIFQRVDELMFHLFPNVERYEGRLRVNRRSLSSNGETPPADGKSDQTEAKTEGTQSKTSAVSPD
jgi:biopolymer transport protein ExbB